MNKTFFTAAALLVLVGCNDDKEQTKPVPGEDTITVTAGIDALTRAPHLNEDGSGYFQDGDKIALTVSGGDKTVRKEYTIGGAALYWEDLGLPSGTNEASFAGCYPASESAEGSGFTFDLSTAADKDLLLAPAVKVSKSADTKVNLAFKHAMHKLAINYASDGTYTQEQLEAVKTTCTAKSSCEVNMAAATVNKIDGKTTAFEAVGKAVRFLLVPQTTEEVTLKIELEGKTVEHTLAGLKDVLKNTTGDSRRARRRQVPDAEPDFRQGRYRRGRLPDRRLGRSGNRRRGYLHVTDRNRIDEFRQAGRKLNSGPAYLLNCS